MRRRRSLPPSCRLCCWAGLLIEASELRPNAMGIVRSSLSWLKSKWTIVWAVWGVPALRPAHQIKRIAAATYISQGDDPQFRLRDRLNAGWYWLELALELPTARTIARVSIDTGSGESEPKSFPLPLKSGRGGRRLLRWTSTARVRIDPLRCSGEFRVGNFRLSEKKTT